MENAHFCSSPKKKSNKINTGLNEFVNPKHANPKTQQYPTIKR